MSFTQENAATIIAQLGGNKFRMMTGAKNFVFSTTDKNLSMRIGRNGNKINFVRVTLTDADLYDVEYGYVRGMNYTVRATESGIYCDMLRGSFERNTGMATSL
tara:strand:- start:1062 stop:1370 length:309 start_codon:yes stop_codon:yes gene_type:complete